jgi:hypothetical protein
MLRESSCTLGPGLHARFGTGACKRRVDFCESITSCITGNPECEVSSLSLP